MSIEKEATAIRKRLEEGREKLGGFGEPIWSQAMHALSTIEQKYRELVLRMVPEEDLSIAHVENDRLRARLSLYEAVVEAAQAENDVVLGLPSSQYAPLAREADRLRVALQALDKETT